MARAAASLRSVPASKRPRMSETMDSDNPYLPVFLPEFGVSVGWAMCHNTNLGGPAEGSWLEPANPDLWRGGAALQIPPRDRVPRLLGVLLMLLLERALRNPRQVVLHISRQLRKRSADRLRPSS